MATTIRAVKTGTIRIRPSHRATDMSKPGWRRRLAIILDRDWTQPLPIYTYLIEHDEGLLLLDCGECARTTKPGWFPWWNPFFNCAVDIHVRESRKSFAIGRVEVGFVTSCAGVRGGTTFGGRHVFVHRCRGFDPSVGGRRGRNAGLSAEA